MFFSKKQFHDYINGRNIDGYSRAVYKQTFLDPGFAGGFVQSLTLKEASVILRTIKKRLADRDLTDSRVGLGKWLRPWHVVPALKQFRPPVGDFGVGVEVEMGFTSMEAVRQVAHRIKDWKNITLDREGGTYPLEVTFPPMLYSKIGKKSQVMRYLDILNSVRDTVVDHSRTSGGAVGTHINVSSGDAPTLANYSVRMSSINSVLSRELTSEQNTKYFGRRPYGYMFSRGTHVEFKLFNSQLDKGRLQQYIDIAVSLTKLLTNTTVPVNLTTVVTALEEGYNKSIPASNVSTSLPLAA